MKDLKMYENPLTLLRPYSNIEFTWACLREKLDIFQAERFHRDATPAGLSCEAASLFFG